MMIAAPGLADLSKMVDLPAIELQSEERIFVLESDPAPVRMAGPAELAKWTDGCHGVSGRIVANSKSTRRNRPSLWR